ncbi:hypothetical protein [Nocardia neocaledoniensis]|uniref:hypothetical protein n=1 Tax=Nocardia neocaledoniensis TaxID=236511 RepID=UPI002454BA7C|nr:hypothetical protein [Nocardia neocaledoniensis]
MTANRARKRANRARAAHEGGSYTAAHYSDPRGAGNPAIQERMRLTGATPEVAARMIRDARARVQTIATDDWSFEARRARQAAEAVEKWEQRRAGRPVRFWTVYVDIWAAAIDEADARIRLDYYLRALYHYAPGIACQAWDLSLAKPTPLADHGTVAEVPDADLTAEQRGRLIADYPPAAWALRDQPSRLYGARETAHILNYVAALERAATRLESAITGPDGALQVVPADTPLRIWRAQRSTNVLAGPDEASARRRGEQLAATVVDRSGRSVGELVAVEPDDGFVSATDGYWVHPAEHIYGKEAEALWADYDAYELADDHATLQAAALRRGAQELAAAWDTARGENARYEAKLHIQPDGTRTLSTPAEFAAVERQAAIRAESLTESQLRELADQDDYMASRVYGKAVDTDDDAKRIEQLHHRATVLRALAQVR